MDSFSDHPDSELLALLEQSGSDLNQPHPIEFSLGAFPSATLAKRVAERLRAEGFGVGIYRESGFLQYSIIAAKSLLPTEQHLAPVRNALAALAAEAGGHYRGWSTQVVPA